MIDTPNDPPRSPRSTGGRPSSVGAGRRLGALLALVALVSAVAACTGDDDDTAAEDAAAEVAAANERADAAEAERDELAAELEAMEEGDSERVTELTASLETAQSELVQAQVDLAEAQADLEEMTARAEAAEARVAEIEEVAGQFPIQLDSSLIPEDMPGRYSITFQEAYCDPGFPLCGNVPSQNVAEIYFDDSNFLRIRVDGVLDAGLFLLDGSLYGITDAPTTLPSCTGAERDARITITMYAGSVSVLDDGTRVVNDVNASINLDVDFDTGECPGGIQFFASTLTKQG